MGKCPDTCIQISDDHYFVEYYWWLAPMMINNSPSLRLRSMMARDSEHCQVMQFLHFFQFNKTTTFIYRPSFVQIMACRPGRRQAIIWTDAGILLTLNVRGPSYLGLTRSISWPLMPWLLTSPGHQQPLYWLCRIGRFLSYLRKDFKYLCHINVEKWHKMQIYVYVPSEKFCT